MIDYPCGFPLCGDLSAPWCSEPGGVTCSASVVVAPGESYTELWDGKVYQRYAQPERGECMLYQNAALGSIWIDVCERAALQPEAQMTCQSKSIELGFDQLIVFEPQPAP